MNYQKVLITILGGMKINILTDRAVDPVVVYQIDLIIIYFHNVIKIM